MSKSDCMNHKISVIVTAYNLEKYIEQCISSIINQTYSNFELIVVNDGSNDHTAEILERMAESDFRISIITQENKGGGGARNTGLEAASGDYLAILDGDDFYDEHMLEHALKKALEHDSDIVIYGAYRYDNESGKTEGYHSALQWKNIPDKAYFNWKDIPGKIFNISEGFVWNKLYKRNFIERYRLRFQGIRRIDDLYFEMRALIKAKRITILNERLCYYRWNNKNSQQGSADQTPETFYHALIAVKEWLIREKVWEEVKQSFSNKALEICYGNLTWMRTWAAFETVYKNLKDICFENLGIMNHAEWYYDRKLYDWYLSVLTQTPAEYLFNRLEEMYSVYGNSGLHFPFLFPKSLIARGEKIILYGAGIVGRAYYIQIFSAGYCDVLLWVDKNYKTIGNLVKSPDAIKNTEFDHVLIAVEKENAADEIAEELLTYGISRNKIVWGM